MLRTVPETAYYQLSVLQTLTPAHNAKPFLASQEMAEEESRVNEERARQAEEEVCYTAPPTPVSFPGFF